MNGLIPIRPGSRVGHVIDAATGCWNWIGAKCAGGYGRVGAPGTRRVDSAHRVYYARANGPIPKGMDLDHLCRNRGCVNPKHLEPVPRHVNAWRGETPKLTPQQVREIRAVKFHRRGDLSALARMYGVHAKTVSDVRSGENWSAVR
jgi:hypothetical protein